MNPKPLSSLNHFTVPVAIVVPLRGMCHCETRRMLEGNNCGNAEHCFWSNGSSTRTNQGSGSRRPRGLRWSVGRLGAGLAVLLAAGQAVHDGGGVGGDRVDVGGAARSLGAERVGPEGRAGGGAALTCDCLLELWVDRALGVDRLDARLLDLVDESLDVSGGWLGLGRERGDDRADHLEAVAGGVVAERVVSGDELAQARRDAPDAGGGLAIEPLKPHEIAGRVAAVLAGPPRVGLRQRVTDRLDGELDVAGVLPPVGVEVPPVVAAGVHALAERQHGGVGAGAVDQVLEPVVDVAARLHRERGVGGGLGVARARLVLVRVRVRLEDLVHVDALAADVADEVGDLRRGGHHLDAGCGSRPSVAAAAAREHGREEGCSGEEKHRPGHGSRSLLIMSLAFTTISSGRLHARRAASPQYRGARSQLQVMFVVQVPVLVPWSGPFGLASRYSGVLSPSSATWPPARRTARAGRACSTRVAVK